MMPKATLLFVGISLGLLSLAYCLPNAVDANTMLTKMNSKRQSSIENNTCVTTQIASGAVSRDCLSAIAADITTAGTGTFINSICAPRCAILCTRFLWNASALHRHERNMQLGVLTVTRERQHNWISITLFCWCQHSLQLSLGLWRDFLNGKLDYV